MTLPKPTKTFAEPPPQCLASDMKLSAVKLVRYAVRLSEAGNEADSQAVIRICQVMQAGEDRLAAYSDESKMGRIKRGTVE